MPEENQVESETQENEIVINETMVPVKNPQISIREEMEADGKYILFNAENELILVINPTGKFILDQCNGEKSINQIIQEIENKFTLKEGTDLLSIVKNYIAILLKAKLIRLETGGI